MFAVPVIFILALMSVPVHAFYPQVATAKVPVAARRRVRGAGSEPV
ncbi:hypothetical protein A33M_4127 [Rhodovulum sp. PH10]|nr:hypothetical protein A33M_4127 [Rhodovulum sp. PH10]